MIVDDSGASRTVRFTRPAELPVYLRAVVTVDAAVYGAASGDSLVKSALYDLGVLQLAGQVLRESACVKAVLAVPGVLDVVVTLGLSTGSLARGNLTPGVRERAAIDTSRITVVR